MDLYKLGSLFLNISIGMICLGAIVRLIVALTYFKRNGSRPLTGMQRATLRKSVLPIAIVALLFGVASLVLLLIC